MLVAGQLWIVAVARDPLWLSLVYVLGWGSSIFALLAGTVLDRVDRKRAFQTSLAVQGALTLAVAGALLAGTLSLPLLYLMMLVFRLLALAQSPAVLVPHLVPKEVFERANGLLMTAALASSALGEALSGRLFDWSPALPFGVSALASLAGGVALASLRGQYRAAVVSRGFRAGELLEGLRWLRREPGYRSLVALRVSADILRVSGFSLLALYATGVLDLGGSGYGLVAAAFGIGGGLAGVLAPSAARKVGLSWGFRGALLLDAAAFALLVAAPHPALAGILVAALGFTASAWGVLEVSLRQAAVPSHLLGRVGGAMQFMSGVAGMAGALAGGASGRVVGARTHYALVAGMVAALGIASLVAIKEPQIRRLRESSIGR